MKNPTVLFMLIIVFVVYSCAPRREVAELNEKLEKQNSELAEMQRQNKQLDFTIDSLSQVKQELNSKAQLKEQQNYKLAQQVEELSVEMEMQQQNLEIAHQRAELQAEPVYKIISKTDTLIQSTYSINSGKVAFYTPKIMSIDETYDAHGIIADVLTDESLRLLMHKKIKEHERDTNRLFVDDNQILIKKVEYYNFIELRLDNVVNQGFEILKVHSHDTQIVSDNMENWHWKITPTKTIPNQQLILKVIVYDTNGIENTSFTKTYHLDVKVRPFQFFYNSKLLFIQNPEWAFGSIIIPFITFLFGRFQRKKSTKKEAAE
jgi:hypothetical protein